MKPRLWLLMIVLLAAPLCFWRVGLPSSTGAARGSAPAAISSLPSQNLMGAGSCAAAACHNANFDKGHPGSEYTSWITRDRDHARAYEVLFDERSKNIQKNLNRSITAYNNQRCLSCHTSPDFDLANPPAHAPYFKTDGVSCESCHGPAKNWLNVHHLDAWQTKTPEQKKALGMHDTRSLAGRAQVCVTCHVGAPGMEVDHDLIAAGHPRLHFEFGAFHAFLPRHWSDSKDRRDRPDFEARVWAIGQLATAQASLELLAEHAGNKEKAWPEFALYDCSSCHHELESPSRRQQQGFGKRKPGAFPWGHQVVMARRILENQRESKAPQSLQRLDQLQKIMDAGNPNRQDIATHAKAAATLLARWQNDLDQQPLDGRSIEEMLRSLLAKDGPMVGASWDEITQAHLGLAALYNAQSNLKLPMPPSLQESVLRVSRNLQPVRQFDPQAIHKRLAEFKNLSQKQGP